MPNPGLCEGEDVCGREVGACEGLNEGVDVWKRGGTMLRGLGKAKVWMCVGSYMNVTHTHTQPPSSFHTYCMYIVQYVGMGEL